MLAENGALPPPLAQLAVPGGREHNNNDESFVCRVHAPDGAIYPGKFRIGFGCHTAVEGGEITAKSFNESYINWHNQPAHRNQPIVSRHGYTTEVFLAEGCDANWVSTGSRAAPRDTLTGKTKEGEPLYICRANLAPRDNGEPKGTHIGYMGWVTNHSCQVSWGGRIFQEQKFEFLQVVAKPIWYRLPIWVYVPLIFVLFTAVAILIHFVRPLWLLQIYVRTRTLGALSQLNVPLLPSLKIADLLNVINLFVLPRLVHAPRTLDAWVRLHSVKWSEVFELEPTVVRCKEYVPLPCRLNDSENGELIHQPASDLLDKLFSGCPIAEVVGVGGAGKTMLTVQICRWALERNHVASGIAMLPVLIEEDTTDIVGTVARKLNAGLNLQIDKDFLMVLLAKGRILVVLDRLSERGDKTLEYVRQLPGTLRIRSMLVSTRRSNTYDGFNVRHIWPIPLASVSMMLFMSALLSARACPGVFETMDQQTDLAKRLVRLISHGEKEIPLTPLLVRLFIDRAVQLVQNMQPLNMLPSSIPQAYFDYLRDVNPKGTSQSHSMSDEDMLHTARILSLISLGENFIPQDFEKGIAIGRLSQAGYSRLDNCDPIERLKLNGIILERAIGARQYLSFALDPVAEYLAADEHLAQCKGNAKAEQALMEVVASRGETTKGFLLALELTREFYRRERRR